MSTTDLIAKLAVLLVAMLLIASDGSARRSHDEVAARRAELVVGYVLLAFAATGLLIPGL